MHNKKPTRSHYYQWKFAESTVDISLLPFLSNEASLYFDYNASSEQIDDINTKLFQRLSHNVLTHATRTQIAVFNAMLNGQTQQEIALHLYGHDHNSNIHKILLGNQIAGTKIKYGGLIVKIKNVCLSDNVYRQLLQEAEQIQENSDQTSYMFSLTRSWFTENIDFLDWIDTPLHPKFRIPIWKIDIMHDMVFDHFLKLKKYPPTSDNPNTLLRKIKSKIDIHYDLAVNIYNYIKDDINKELINETKENNVFLFSDKHISNNSGKRRY